MSSRFANFNDSYYAIFINDFLTNDFIKYFVNIGGHLFRNEKRKLTFPPMPYTALKQCLDYCCTLFRAQVKFVYDFIAFIAFFKPLNFACQQSRTT